jgi:hypothetical protein
VARAYEGHVNVIAMSQVRGFGGVTPKSSNMLEQFDMTAWVKVVVPPHDIIP